MYTSLRRLSVTIAAAGALATTAAFAVAGPAHASPAMSYHFQTLNNTGDLTFNQLLGINNEDVIAGYFGSVPRGIRIRATSCGGRATTGTRISPVPCRPRSPG